MSARRETRKGGKALRPYPGDALLALLSALLLILSFAHSVDAGPGDLDATFGIGGRVLTDFGGGDRARAVALQADGKIVVAGSSSAGAVGADFALARYNPGGSLDPTFGSGGRVLTDFGVDDEARAVALQADGKIVVAGGFGGAFFALARYNPNGTLDTSFGSEGRVFTNFGGRDGARALALQADGKIVAAGFTSSDFGVRRRFALARYNADGTLDPSFGGGHVVTSFADRDEASALALQSDGKIVVAGFSGAGGRQDFALARYNPNGTLDPFFGSGGRVLTDFGGDDEAAALALQSDGKIVVAGFSDVVGFGSALARYNPDGTLDPSFGSGGRVLTGGVALASGLVLQADGRIVVAGVSAGSAGDSDFALARYNPDGSPDPSFGSGGRVLTDFGGGDQAFALALQPDGKIVVAGEGSIGFGNDIALARYETVGLAVAAPAVLGVAPDLAPGAPTGAVVWAPNPFQVDAFFTNPGPGTNVTLTLDLSTAGTQLTSVDPASVVFSSVAQGQTVQAQWQVRAVAPGEAHYRVRATENSSVLEKEVVTRVPELVVPPVDNPLNQGPFPLVADGRFCIQSGEGRNDCVADFEGNVGGVPSTPFEWQGITPTGFKAGPTGAVPVLLNDPDLDSLVYAAVDTTAIGPPALDLYLMYDFIHRLEPFGPTDRPTVEFEVKAGRFQTPPGSRMVVTFRCDQDTVVVDGFDNITGVPVPFSGRSGADPDLGIEGHCGFGPSPNPSGDPSFDVRFNTAHARFELEVPLRNTARPDAVYDPSPAFWTAAAPGSGTLVLSQNTLSIDITTGGTTVTPLQPQATAPLVLRKGEMRLERDRDEDEDKDEREDRLSLRGSFVVPPDSINPPAEGVTVTLVDGDGQIAEIRIPPGEGWKTSRGPEWVFKDKKNRSLADPLAREKVSIKFNRERGRFDVRVNVKDTELTDPDAGPITTTLTIGDQTFVNTQAWRSKDRGRKLVTP